MAGDTPQHGDWKRWRIVCLTLLAIAVLAFIAEFAWSFGQPPSALLGFAVGVALAVNILMTPYSWQLP